jgi:mRNA interferase RelE/StbE
MFTVLLQPSARRVLDGLSRDLQKRIITKLETLESNPYPPDAKKLRGEEAFRVRVGDYRIVYEVQGKQLVVLVLRIGHRREVYR